MIPYMSLPSDSVIALPKANSRVLFHQFVQLVNDVVVIPWLTLITMGAGTYMNSLTRLTMADTMLFHHVFSQAVFLVRRQSFFSMASFNAS